MLVVFPIKKATICYQFNLFVKIHNGKLYMYLNFFKNSGKIGYGEKDYGKNSKFYDKPS